jgi:membrane protein DedA with SNARE-associated domain
MLAESIASYLAGYGSLAILGGSFFFGETVILTAAALSAQGIFPIYEVLAISFLGTILSDSLWFLGGNMVSSWIQRSTYSSTHAKFTSSIAKAFPSNPFAILLLYKFMYGTRVLTILYTSSMKMPYAKFALYDSIGTLIWLFVLVPIGYLVGQGVLEAFPNLTTPGIISALLIGAYIFNKLLGKWVTQKIMK